MASPSAWTFIYASWGGLIEGLPCGTTIHHSPPLPWLAIYPRGLLKNCHISWEEYIWKPTTASFCKKTYQYYSKHGIAKENHQGDREINGRAVSIQPCPTNWAALQTEYVLITLYSVPGISAVPHEDNLRYFDVSIHGPSQSPYEGMLQPCHSCTDLQLMT